MAFAFDVVSGIPRLTQTGTDANLGGMATAINAVATVARSTAVAAGAILRPPTPTGLWYRCTTAGTTAATAPTYGTTEGGSTTDGTAIFNAFLAPIIRTIAGGNHYYMPSVRVQINGTLTNANPQQNTFTCFDIEMSGGNWTSGAYASDGVTPLWDGTHFIAMRQGSVGAEETDGGLRLLSAAQFTFIGGEVQVAGSIVFNSGTTPRTYGTRWRNSREFGATSARIRSKTTLAIFSQIELFDIAYDLFVMPTFAPSIKARGSEYLYQYVGSQFGGADARFVAFDLENPSGLYDFDNFGSGWVELYNCKSGAALRVFSQHPSSTFLVKHCVPLYQDLVITAKDTAGAAVQDVRFTATESPTNSPTVTFSTQSNLKTWDFRTPLSYQTTTNSSGIATSSPVLNVWYWQTTFRQSLRFPSSTAIYQGRAYNFKTLNVSAVLGTSAAVPVSAGMIGLDTATTINETASLALTGITLTPSGANGGVINVTANCTWQDIWNFYRGYISQFANYASNDTWTCIGGVLDSKEWTLNVATGATISTSANISSYKTNGTVTLNGSAQITSVYTSSAGTSSILQFIGASNTGVVAVWNSSTLATELFQTNVSGSAANYTLYYPPSATGLVKNYARELFGYQRVAGSVTLVAGLNTVSFVDIPDVGITQTNQATVLAYTAIETASKFYDRTAAFRLSEQGIKLGQIAARSGTAIEIGSFSHVINQSAVGVYAVVGSTITTKSTAYAGDTKYSTEIATPPATITAATTEVITIAREDANGDSQITIQAAGVSTFEVWKITDATPPDDYATGTLVATVGIGTWRFLHADGYQFVIRDQTTNYRVVVQAEKGIYTAELFFGAQVQLAQAAEVSIIDSKVDIMQVDLDAIKGTGFTKDQNSLINISIDTQTIIGLTA